MNFKIIERAEMEEILGLKILFIPEEYPENSEEYYKPFKENQYNIIFGHGTWEFVAQPGQIEQSKKDVHSAPVFIWNEWKNCIPDGFVSFGHIHGRNTYGKKIYYSGSFTRWNFGERSEKGFTYFEYDLENKTYKVEYVNNTEAPSFDVVSVKELGIDLDNTSADEIQTLLNQFITETNNLRIDLSGLSKEKVEILKEFYSHNPRIKTEVREGKSLLKESVASEKKEFEKWHYITKRKLPLNETIKKYCKEELHVDLSLAKIDAILKDD